MRRLASIVTILACAVAVAAGCGGDGGSGSGLDSALSYVPKSTPFVLAVETDPDSSQYKSLDAILGKFPGGELLKDALKQQVESGRGGVSFDKDVKPLLGNPFVVSGTDASSFISSAGENFVAAIKVADTDALDRLIEKTKPRKQGEVSGATVYEDDGSYFARDDDVVVFAGTEQRIKAAIERANGGDHLDTDTFENSLDGLSGDALARVYLDVHALIERDPDTASARKIEWVSALRALGLTLTAHDDSLDVQFNMHTDADGLTDADLPLASGDEAPKVVREPGQIGVAVRDPSQIVTFFETAFQAADPQGSGDYEAGKRALATRYDLDLDRDVFAQLKRDLAVTIAPDGAFGARAELKDAAAFEKTVPKLAKALPQLGSSFGVTKVRRRGSLYEVRTADGGSFVFGVVGGVFVVASDPARALKLAQDKPTAVEGASGSLAVAADAERLAARVLRRLAPNLGLGGGFSGALFARPLRDLTGSVETSTDGMKGKFTLSLD